MLFDYSDLFRYFTNHFLESILIWAFVPFLAGFHLTASDIVVEDFPLSNRESCMSAHVLLDLLNELKKSYKTRGLSSILFVFRNEF